MKKTSFAAKDWVGRWEEKNLIAPDKNSKNIFFIKAIKYTALHQGLSNYLTAQDTHVTLTLTKHN